jgi:hypothetical protein
MLRCGAAALGANQGTIQRCLFGLYAVIARLALAGQRGGGEARRLVRAARDDIAGIRKWAADAPMNFLHHQRLAEAELAAAEGRDGEAAALYDEAIARARLGRDP